MKKASAIIDYTILVVVIITVLITMGGYIKRGLMNKYRETGDAFGHGRQYEPVITSVKVNKPVVIPSRQPITIPQRSKLTPAKPIMPYQPGGRYNFGTGVCDPMPDCCANFPEAQGCGAGGPSFPGGGSPLPGGGTGYPGGGSSPFPGSELPLPGGGGTGYPGGGFGGRGSLDVTNSYMRAQSLDGRSVVPDRIASSSLAKTGSNQTNRTISNTTIISNPRNMTDSYTNTAGSYNNATAYPSNRSSSYSNETNSTNNLKPNNLTNARTNTGSIYNNTPRFFNNSD